MDREETKKSHKYKMFKLFTREFKISDELKPPTDVVEAFAKYATNGDDEDDGASAAAAAHLSADQLCRFLIEYQEEEDESRAQSESERIVQLMCHRRRSEDLVASENYGGLTVDEFFQYLFDDDLNGPINTEVHHEMTSPLQQYFIFTGHNSYLTGNQLNSDCCDTPIIRALRRGVRVIELDLWPNSSKDDINVVHGWTLTTPVSLRKCLTSIREHAFESSSYPVIIDLEDHLTPILQVKVAEMVTEIFGDMLYYPNSNNIEDLPSPEELKHRVLLSARPPIELPEDDSLQEEKEEEQIPEEEEEAILSDCEEVEIQDSSTLKNEPIYKQLITIQSCKPTSGLKHALTTGFGNAAGCLNLSEGALKKAVLNYSTHIIRFTPSNFIRMYPKGMRIKSSNYQPMVAWTHGAQMVAFNMQGYDKALWLMHGMFKANGGCGYIKKPKFLLNNEPHLENYMFDPKAHNGVKTTLKIQVYMGEGWKHNSETHGFDAYSPPDFYIKLRLQGVPTDCDKNKTKVIHDNWVPIWDEEFSFELTVPELALLRFEVREYDRFSKDDFGGQTCLPVSEIKPGIRAVQLFDKKGEKLPNVKLLMRFQFVPNN